MTTAVVETPPATPSVTPPTGQAGTPPAAPPQAPPATPAAVAPPSEPPAAPPAPPTAPATYTLALPQGGVVDDTDVATVSAMARERNWSNEQAQAALDELNASLVKQAADFRADLDAHPEIGGTKFAQAQESAMRALDRFLPATSPEGAAFRQALNKSGYGNYAPLMLLLSRIGKAMGEDKPMSGSPALEPAAPKTLAEALYPTTTPR